MKIIYAEAKAKLHTYKLRIQQLESSPGTAASDPNPSIDRESDDTGSGTAAAMEFCKLEIDTLRNRMREVDATLQEATTKYFELFDLYEVSLVVYSEKIK